MASDSLNNDAQLNEILEREEYQHLRVTRRGFAAVVTLARPEVHNAFNARLIAELHAVFQKLDQDDDVRAVVLEGEGPSFCAGADLNWMRESLTYRHDENVNDALRMADMFRAIDNCRHPVIGRIHGAALGGGSGLTSVCDIAIAAEGTVFGFTEARLGIAPAVIAPFAMRKIGVSWARALFVTAERFDAPRALQIGLVHAVVPADQLDEAVTTRLRDIGRSGPAGVRAAKVMASTVLKLPDVEAREMTAATIAGLRVSEEGQEGIRAFLEKRRAGWVRDDV
jgi:methylglutaconyl-CoA hydratase